MSSPRAHHILTMKDAVGTHDDDGVGPDPVALFYGTRQSTYTLRELRGRIEYDGISVDVAAVVPLLDWVRRQDMRRSRILN